ncbi:MAG: hypothetical protein JL50_10490 [Peptococcaceae bacterium BICA1-7]|nr:MAG: hypothetical protein JL50_10490 [Peptococcaceae bacterium BICA1-7]HBV95711.1 hypothetical protein [Desulfotomaculum sp.]
MADRGTVIRTFGNRAFIMNEKCQFLEVKTAAALQPGDQIEYLPRDIIRPGRSPARVLAVAASFIIVCLVAFSSFQHMLTGKVYAYIGMEINPSIEIGINSENKVVRLKGYNDDGKRLIGSRDLLNKDIDDALRAIIRDCREGNYLSGQNDNEIAVSVSITGGADGSGLIQKVNIAAQDALLENGVSARVRYFSMDENTMELAREQDVSPLKYMLWEEAGRLGYSIPLQSVSISDPRIKEIAADKEEKVGGGDAAGSETPPSDGPAVAAPAEGSPYDQESGGKVGVPKVKDLKPDSRSTPGPKPKAKPAEAGNNGAGKSEKESDQPGGEVKSPGPPGDEQRESKGPREGPPESPEGKNTEDKGPVKTDNAVKPDKEDTKTEESSDSAEAEAAGSEAAKAGTEGSVKQGNSSGSGGGSSGGSSGGGGKSGGGSRGGGGGSGGKGK